jgi:hypothetical protein
MLETNNKKTCQNVGASKSPKAVQNLRSPHRQLLSYEGTLPQDRQCTYNVTLRRFRVTTVPISITYLSTCVARQHPRVCGWMHRRLRMLVRRYPYLSRMLGAAILSYTASHGTLFSTLSLHFRKKNYFKLSV